MRFLALLFILILLPVRAWAIQDVVSTVHNLSTSGPGTFKSLTVEEVCIFCHTPHHASPANPLWNHTLSGQSYTLYTSTTMDASPGQPTGKSRLCLACHDGTVALGALGSGTVTGLESTFLTGRAELGTDLADDHPISFTYDTSLASSDGELVNPASTGLPLENGELQCATCHDPHERDIEPFLQMTSANGQICTACHAKAGTSWNWTSASHAISTATPSGANPWSERKAAWRASDVAGNSCFGCHTPHNATTPARLDKNQEENTCYLCHDATVAATDIEPEMLKASRHPVDTYTGIHDPTEEFVTSPPTDHVECADCHNMHAADDTAATAPDVPGAVVGVSGVNSGNVMIPESDYTYEICFKCHADNSVISSPTLPRQIVEINTRIEFDTANPSHHAVEGAGANTDVPSLIPPWTENSILYCTDCHSNDSGPRAGGSGPEGPHGSIYDPLLIKNYSTADNTSESATAYALCYTCHDRSSILGDNSFSKHKKHIQGEKSPCSLCHDAHGVAGTAANNTHLINFRTDVLSPVWKDGQWKLWFEDTGSRRGECYVDCHGKDHKPKSYN